MLLCVSDYNCGCVYLKIANKLKSKEKVEEKNEYKRKTRGEQHENNSLINYTSISNEITIIITSILLLFIYLIFSSLLN